MDCFDALVLLAKPEELADPSAGLEAHLTDCDACEDLRANLAGETSLVPPADDLIGCEVGPYRIESVIGAGGMGRVYRAVHSQIDTDVAIKVLSNKAIESDHLVSRFFAEARAAGVIKHENIVNVLDVGRLNDGRPFLIMEHLLGQPLSALIRQPRLTDSLARELALDMLAALEATHAINIVHRDLKPDNIFVSPQGRATLLDFGIAKLAPKISGQSMHTATGLILGTPHYMAPEQAAGDAVDARADLYSMGVILYECVTGQRPFGGASFYHLANEHHHRAPRPPSDWRDDLSNDLEAIILKALAKQPMDRFQSAAEMRSALERCHASEASGGFAVDETTPKRAESSARVTTEMEGARPLATAGKRIRRGLWLAAAVAVVAAIVALVAILQRASEPIARRSVEAGSATGQPVGPSQETSTRDAAPGSALVDAAAPPHDASVDEQPSLGRDASGAPVAKRRARGVRPLSRLAEATRLALDIESDAVLTRIEIAGLNDAGLIRWNSFKNEVRMYFYSPSLVARYQQKRPNKVSRCGIRVTFKGAGPLDVGRAHLRCSRLRPVPTPSCSLAEILRRAHKQKNFPNGATPEKTMLRVLPTKRARPMWKFDYKGVKYGQPSC